MATILGAGLDADSKLKQLQAQTDQLMNPGGFIDQFIGGFTGGTARDQIAAGRSLEEEQARKAQIQRVQDAEALGALTRAQGGQTGPGAGYAVAQALEASPDVRQAALTGIMDQVNPQPDAPMTPMQQAELMLKHQAIAKNEEAFRRNGFTPTEMAGAKAQLYSYNRSMASRDELDTLANMDLNLIKGGPAAMTKYITDSLMPTIMDLINTGVINSPAEMERVMSFLPKVSGAGGVITFDETNRAKIRELKRWLDGKAQDKAASYGIDLNEISDRRIPRSAEELNAEIAGYSVETGEVPEGFEKVTPGGLPGFRKIGKGVDEALEDVDGGVIGEWLG